MQISQLLNLVPDYATFYTVDELDAQIDRLARTYPDVIRTQVIGVSRQGHPIKAMILGHGEKNALCFACPHPNEPIGAMTLTTMGEIFGSNPQSLAETGFTWYLIPCIDPDSTRLNEGWFKGPYSLLNYARNFYRPPGNKQVEWTFPINIRGAKFDEPRPETQALMRLIDELHPRFMFSLHNCAFGGAYWYLTDNIPELCAKLENAARRQDVPLHLGEPESAYITKYSPAVHSMMSITAMVNYMIRFGGGVPRTNMKCGGCSADYIANVCKCMVMMAELPYFYDKRIADTSEVADMTRRAAVLENIRLNTENYAVLGKYWSQVHVCFHDDNPFFEFVDSCIESNDAQNKAKENWAKGPQFEKPATVSEVFDNIYGSRLFECLNVALAVRACAYELGRAERLNLGASELLSFCHKRFSDELTRMCAWLEAHVDYEVISIRRLVSVQLESALLAVEQLNKGAETHGES